MQTFTLDPVTGIHSTALTDDQIFRAKVLGGPRTIGGPVEFELDGDKLFGTLLGQAADAAGLRLSPVAYPTSEDAQRARHAQRLGKDATAALIDRSIAEWRAMQDA